MTRLKIHPWDITPMLERIRLKERKCSDGQCCSYDVNDPDLPKKVFDKYYWILEYKSKLYSYVHQYLRAACPDLEVDFSEDKGILFMGTYCKTYSDRPQQCKDFGTKIKCNFKEYVENFKEKQYYHSLFVFVLGRDKFLDNYPFLSKFDLSRRYPQLNFSLAGSYLSDGLYIPIPAEEKVLPNQFPLHTSPIINPATK